MDLNRRNNKFRAVTCIVYMVLAVLICMPIITHSFIRDNCYLDPDEGNCTNRLSLRVKYYFNANIDECSEFIFFGCGGNENRFDTFDQCENVCVLFNNGL